MAQSAGPGQNIRRREGEEVWESLIQGDIWLPVTDVQGKERQIRVRGGGKLRITPLDRELIQEMCVSEELDMFLNGFLRRIDGDQNEDPKTQTEYALGTEDLVAIFELTGEDYEQKVDSLNEIGVRRMIDLADPADATLSQATYLKDSLTERWPIGGDTPTYREMQAEEKTR